MLLNDAASAVMLLGVCATVASSVVAISRAYVRGIEAKRNASLPDTSPEVQARMTRIEQAVDAIAIEVERMSEGQRFTTKLLAERLGDASRGLAGGTAPSIRRSGEHGTNGAGGSHDR
jgi:hypothetical protein